MYFSKPGTSAGGGEIKRDTASFESSVNSAGASEARGSRNTSLRPSSTGRAVRQSIETFSVERIAATTGSAVPSSMLFMSVDAVESVAPDDVVAPDHVVAPENVAGADVAPHDVGGG